MAHDQLGKIREAFLRQNFGDPDLVAHPMLPDLPHIDVNIYPPSTTGRPYFTLVTDGLSDYRLDREYAASDWACDRAELIMYLPALNVAPMQTQLPWELEFLRMISRLPAKTDLRPEAFLALANQMPPEPLVPGSALTHAILLPPWAESVEVREGFDAPDETSVEYLWLDFASSAEAAFLDEQGPAAFLALLVSRGHAPPTRLRRDCYLATAAETRAQAILEGNRIRQLETRAWQGDEGPLYGVIVAIDIDDASVADSFVAALVRKVAVQRMRSPPTTTILLVTLVGDLSARAFADLWRKHSSRSPAMTFFLSRMSQAAAVHGTRAGQKLDECSLLDDEPLV